MRALLHGGMASHPLLRASLRARVAVALTIVYLMILKPDLGASLLLIGAALATGAASSLRRETEKP
jgi:cell division protein FtsW (lipid II flippase)